MVKTVVSFALGFLCGGAAAWIFSEKRATKRINEEVEAVRHLYKKMNEQKDETPVASDEFLEEASIAVNDYARTVEDACEVQLPKHKEDSLVRSEREYHDYTQHYGGQMSDENYDTEYAKGLQATEEHKIAEEKSPVVVDEYTFDEDTRLSERQARYYIENGVLTIGDEYDQEEKFDFEDVERMLGDTLEESGFADDDSDVLYVFNEAMGTKYRIDKMYSAYVDG